MAISSRKKWASMSTKKKYGRLDEKRAWVGPVRERNLDIINMGSNFLTLHPVLLPFRFNYVLLRT